MLTRIELPLFRALLQRRLLLFLPLSYSIRGCGRPLDSYGHHRAARGRTGVLGMRGPVRAGSRRHTSVFFARRWEPETSPHEMVWL